MDSEKLIERIKCPQIHSCPMDGEYPSCAACQKNIKQEAATALQYLSEGADEVNAALQEQIAENKKFHAENDMLRAELEQVKRALAMMWYAYDNKDGEFPHEYEIEAMQEAENVLGPWAECMPKYLQRGPEKED